MPEIRVSPRERLVLTAIIELYIATGEPVASQAVADHFAQIEEIFSGVASSNEYLERTSHVLALISSGLGVALASGTADQVLEHIHFSRLSGGRVLAVLVTKAGAVLDRVLVLDREMTSLEL